MGYEDEQFLWSDEECLENYVDWAAPASEGITLDYLKKNGFARLNVGCKDTRAPHKNGNFPTASGKCEFLGGALVSLHPTFNLAKPFFFK